MESSRGPRLQPRAIAKEIRSLYADGQAPSFNTVNIGSWLRALDILIEEDDLRAARFGAALLLARHPDLKQIESLCRMIDVAPRADERSAVSAQRHQAVQIVPREGAKTVVFVLTGHLGTVGMPVGLARRWFHRLDASIVYLHDFSRHVFFDGLRPLADSREGTIDALRKIADGLGASRIACYGHGIGGYAASLYGIGLGADAVVAIEGTTSIPADRERLQGRLTTAGVPLTLEAMLAGVVRPPRILIVTGEGRSENRVDLNMVARLPSVETRIVERHQGPGAASELVCRGQFERLLDWLMTAGPETPHDVGEFKYYPWREQFA